MVKQQLEMLKLHKTFVSTTCSMYIDYRCMCFFHLDIVIFEGKLYICFDLLYFVFAFSAYVQEIFDTYRNSSKNSLKDAALKLKDMSPKPMDSMFEKQTREEALKKRSDRRAMVILDVPPTTPGTVPVFISYISWHLCIILRLANMQYYFMLHRGAVFYFNSR